MPYCSKCGNFETEGTRICGRCGSPIVIPRPADETTEELAPGPASEPYRGPAQVPPVVYAQPAPPPRPYVPPPQQGPGVPLQNAPYPPYPGTPVQQQGPATQAPPPQADPAYYGNYGANLPQTGPIDPPQRLRHPFNDRRLAAEGKDLPGYEPPGGPTGVVRHLWDFLGAWGPRAAGQMRTLSVFLILSFVVPWAISEKAPIRDLYKACSIDKKMDSKIMFSWDAASCLKRRNEAIGKQGATVSTPLKGPTPETFDPVYLLVLGIIGAVIAFAPTIPAQFKAVLAMIMLGMWFAFDGWFVPPTWLLALQGQTVFFQHEDVEIALTIFFWALFVTGVTGGLLRYGKPGRIVARLTSLLAATMLVVGAVWYVRSSSGTAEMPFFQWLIEQLEGDGLSTVDKIPFALVMALLIGGALLTLATVPLSFARAPTPIPEETSGPGGPHVTYVIQRRGDFIEGTASLLLVLTYVMALVLLSIQVKVAMVGGFFILLALGTHIAWLMGGASFLLGTIMGFAVPPGYRLSQSQ